LFYSVLVLVGLLQHQYIPVSCEDNISYCPLHLFIYI